MPWETLGLNAETASERDVKRAYAKLLKQNRPDKDPEGFQKLKEARDLAMMELDYGRMVAAPAESPVYEAGVTMPAEGGAFYDGLTDTESDPLQGRAIEGTGRRPAAFEEGLESLTRALEKDSVVAERMRDFEEVLYAHPHLASEWGREVSKLMDRYPYLPDFKLKPEAVLFELEHDSSSATVSVVQRLEREGRREGIGSLSVLLIKNRTRIATGAGGAAAARLASASAIWDPMRVKALSDMAFELLPPGWREGVMNAIEMDVSIGQLVRSLPVKWRAFWTERLREPHADWDWESDESQAALDYIRRQHSKTWEGLDVLPNILPDHIARTLPRRGYQAPPSLRAAGAYSGQTSSYDPQPVYDQGRRGFPAWGIWIAVFLVIKMVVLVASLSDSPSSGYSGSTPPISESSKEEQLSAEEVLRQIRAMQENRGPTVTPGQGIDPDNPLWQAFESQRQGQGQGQRSPQIPNPQPYVPTPGSRVPIPGQPGGRDPAVPESPYRPPGTR